MIKLETLENIDSLNILTEDRTTELNNTTAIATNTVTFTLCAIGDSFTYLNDHLDETANRVKKGYLTRLKEKIPNLIITNLGINGANTASFINIVFPFCDLYTILLGTNDWNGGASIGTYGDFENATSGTVTGNLGVILNNIKTINSNAKIIILTPTERADFVYIIDNSNIQLGSYDVRSNQKLSDVAKAIKSVAIKGDIPLVDLYNESGFSQYNAVKYKRLKVNGVYTNLPYPNYVGVAYDHVNDEYPYPPDAIALTNDGLHPSDYGNEIISKLLEMKIKEVFALV